MSIVEKVEEHREDWQRHEAALQVDQHAHEMMIAEGTLNAEYSIIMEAIEEAHKAVQDLFGMDNEYGLETLERR